MSDPNLESQYRSLRQDVDGLKSNFSNLETRIKSIEKEMAAIERGLDKISQNIQDLHNTTHSDLNILKAELAAGILSTTIAVNGVEKEVTRGIEAEAQSKVLEQISDLSSDMALIDASNRRIDNEYIKSLSRVSNINKKFDVLNDNIKTAYITDLKRLGKYIFDILENHYQKVIESRLKTQHIELFDNVISTIDKVKNVRDTKLREEFKKANGEINGFLNERSKFLETVKNIQINNFKLNGEINIPFIVSEKSDNIKVSAGLNVEVSSNKNNNIKLNEIEEFNEYNKLVSSKTENLNWREMNNDEITNLSSNIKKLVSNGYITEEYSNLLISALKVKAPKTVEIA